MDLVEKQELELYRKLIDELPNPVFVKDDKLRLIKVNRPWLEICGRKEEDIIGKTDAEIFPSEDVDVYLQNDLRVFDSDEVQVSREQFTTGAGEKKWILTRKAKLSLDDGNNYLIGTFADITELTEREKELEEARKVAEAAEVAKSEFLANMSHEIRTPMNGVMGMAELLANSDLNSKQAMFTDVIVKSGASLLTIINDILDFSKLDAGQMQLDPAPFAIRETVEDVATLVSSKVAEKDLELIVRVDPKIPEMLIGDVGRIRQIVTNLMGNAVKFTESGHIYVNVEGANGTSDDAAVSRLKFSVEDTGVGIPADSVARVFEKFSQVDNSATRKHEGTGLGLSICSHLVELMEGQIGVDSEEGMGSTFWFEIELPVHGESKIRPSVPMDVSGSRILVVDDNPVNRSILMEQMATWNFDAAAAASGPEAMTLIDAIVEAGIQIDAIVMDYQMPGMSGGQVVKELKGRPDTNEIPVIMLTSVDQTEDGQAFSSLGIQAHLTKPTRSSMLLETIIGVLQISKHERNIGMTDRHPVTATRKLVNSELRGDEASEDIISSNPRIAVQQIEKSHGQDITPNENGFLPESETNLDVLVCEDNEVNQIVFSQILEEIGVSFKIASDGKEGLSLYKFCNPSLILMDVSMPRMNGLETTRAIRELEASNGQHTPIIGATAHAIKGDKERCLEAGMDDYVSKPISPNALIEKIQSHLIGEAVKAG